MNLTFLGYGSNSFSSINTVSFLVEHEDHILLFDCGPSVTNNMHSIVNDFGSIDYVFISHSHFDHMLGLPYFIIGRHLDIILQKKKNPLYAPTPLNVYLPHDCIELIKALLNVCHSDIQQLSYEIIYHDLGLEKESKIDDICVHSFSVNHTVDTFGFIISVNDNKIIGYSSDTLYDDDIINNFKNCLYLILEGMVPDSESVFSKNSKHATFNQMRNVVDIVNPIQTFVVHLQPRYINNINTILAELNNDKSLNISFPKVGVPYVLYI